MAKKSNEDEVIEKVMYSYTADNPDLEEENEILKSKIHL